MWWRHGWSAAAAVGVLLSYVTVLWGMPKHVFWSPDEGGKFIELHCIAWHAGLRYSMPYAAQRIDPEFKFYPHVSTPDGDTFPYPVAGSGGTVRFNWPIWFPLLSGFMLRAFGLPGIYVIPLLSGWLLALVSGRIAHSFNPRFTSLTILLVGLATPVCFYSQCFWEHTFAALFALIAVAILVRARPGSMRALVAMTYPLIAATMLRIEMVAFALAAVLTWAVSAVACRTWSEPAPVPSQARRLRRWWSIVLLAGAAAGIFWLAGAAAPARQQRFITALPARMVRTPRLLPQLPRSVVSVLVNTGRNEGPVVDPRWVTVACVGVLLCLMAPLLSAVRIEAAVIAPALLIVLAYSASVAFLGQRYRSLHGIFPVAPFMVVAFYALPEAWRRRDAALLALSSFAVLYLVIGCAAIFAFYVDVEGGLLTGLEWGQRYLLALYPVLTILSVVALYTYRESNRPAWLKRYFVVMVAAMMTIGVQQEVRGSTMLRFNREELAACDRELRTEGPLVTDLWWLPTTVAPLFLTKEMSYVQNPAELAEWVALAAAQGIPRFTFVSLVPIREGQLADAPVRLVPQGSRSVFGLHLTRLDVISTRTPPAAP